MVTVQTNSKIFHQRKMALEFMTWLDEAYIPMTSIVAGGAPLSWYFGKEARDVDIYISIGALDPRHFISILDSSELYSSYEIKSREKKPPQEISPLAGLLAIVSASGDRIVSEDYLGRNIKVVLEIEVEGVVLNLIVLSTETLHEITQRFDLNFCKIYWDGLVSFSWNNEFLSSVSKKGSFHTNTHSLGRIRKYQENYKDFFSIQYTESGPYIAVSHAPRGTYTFNQNNLIEEIRSLMYESFSDPMEVFRKIYWLNKAELNEYFLESFSHVKRFGDFVKILFPGRLSDIPVRVRINKETGVFVEGSLNQQFIKLDALCGVIRDYADKHKMDTETQKMLEFEEALEEPSERRSSSRVVVNEGMWY